MRLFVLSLCYFLCQFTSYRPQGNPTQQDQTATQASAPRITVKGDVMKKKLVHKVTPIYPKEARDGRIAGTLKLRVVIGIDGSVKQVEYVSGPEVFVKPTIEAVRQNKYKPTTENGQPVEVDTTVDTVFSLIQ